MLRVARREPEALQALYDRHSPIVYAICLRILRDPGEAEQVLIDVFAEAWDRPLRFDAARGTPIAYLTLMARSRALDAARRRKAEPDALGEADCEVTDAAATGQALVDAEQRAAVRRALGALPPDQRQVVELSFYDGLTHAEIATKVDRPLGTVKSQVRQGLLKMRDALRQFWEGEASSR